MVTFDTSEEDAIVAYSVNGNPLKRGQYKAELLEAIAEINRGEYITQEDLEKESDNW